VAILEGGLSGLSLIIIANGKAIEVITILIPKIYLLSVEKTKSGFFGVCPANTTPVHTNAIKFPKGIAMQTKAIINSLSLSEHHLLAS